MIYQTRGIVLHRTVFADNKAMFHIYTVRDGMCSYMAYLSLKKERKSQWVKMQPLTVVELKAERKREGAADYLKSVEIGRQPGVPVFDYLKSSVKMFLNELLYKILQSAPPDESLFRFVEDSLLEFEREKFVPDFHLRFLWRLTRHLGCVPQSDYSESRPYFYLEAACFSPVKRQTVKLLSEWILRMASSDGPLVCPEEVLPSALRAPMLDCLLSYYSQHVSSVVSGVQSHKVLKEMLR